MWSILRAIVAGLRTWWASQFMAEPPPFQAEPEEEDMIYHILPYPETSQPLLHNEEYFVYKTPDAGQDAAVTRGPEYRDGRRQ